MPTFAGLVAASVLLAIALNILPGVGIGLPLQAGAVICLLCVNVAVWVKAKPPPMPLREAVATASAGFAVIAAIAVVDTLIGFAGGAQTVPEAFIHSGAFGGITDACVFVSGLFVGVPTLVRSVCMFQSKSAGQ